VRHTERDAGPVVAGVIGRHKFTYDLWGGTVNPPVGWSRRDWRATLAFPHRPLGGRGYTPGTVQSIVGRKA
jgi:hypothetical protein